MSDAFFKKVFGDSEPTHVGSGWVSGVLGVFFGLLGLGGALCLHFPALLTLPEARSHYPMAMIRLLIQGRSQQRLCSPPCPRSCGSARFSR
jgi:hypothetical protein